ncbi:hypothetical protein M409DRAFT_63492 [Zasmidium cellare ATCC 36951]|uniref:Transcription factor domain-containing protein n=1 Tax=Zasmidium cellare ATCC 36951 TaxID=1080233 RepID=A0A6A6CXM4_ZASCE|nr:uncharacterized protein M409DRAFT_63492 [Zasmidium cellare ATCC 36951]KAF2171967.1 hypothetical protein M409DRAFT_63492 [Zasmidium cellare ATCC 36951]
MDRDCVPAVPKPRKRRTESAVGLETEQHGMSLLEFAGPSSSSTAGPPPQFDAARHKQADKGAAERNFLLGRHDLSHVDSKSFVQLFRQGLGNILALEELLHGVDFNFVSSSFTIFRQLTPHFPFIELSPGADIISMVAQRPLLTLAICTVASAAYPELQERLSQAFQYALSPKVILGSERSMDLLTGLLVYLAWHHHYMTQPQVYHQLYLLAGLAADLGLYRPRLDPMDPPSALERDRAFVGCYYLCSSLSAAGFDKPSPLRWTRNLRTCAENAAISGTLSSDRSLVPILELAHALDEMEESIRHDIASQYANPLPYVDLQTKATSQRLKALKREHSSLASSLAFEAAQIHIYHRLLRLSDTPDYPILIQCACAIKEYLENLTSRPPPTLHQLPIVDWAHLLEILVLMARISKPLPNTSSWEAGALASMLQPDVVLDGLWNHANSAPSNDPLAPRHEALLQSLRRVCDGVKRILATGQSGSEGKFRPAGGEGEVVDVFKAYGYGVLDPTFLNSLIAA